MLPIVSLNKAVVMGLVGVLTSTFTVMSLEVSPAANVNVPDGRAEPDKSEADAWFVPLPVTAQFTL